MEPVRRIVSLDLLRGLASFIVAFFWHYQHFGVSGGDQPAYLKLSELYRRGWIFVEFFFILSGFIFSYVYLDKIRKNGLSELKSYAISRFARLYPMHFLSLVIVLMLLIVNQAPFIYQENTEKNFILHLLFLQNGFFTTTYSFNGPSWSISCEILMYVLFFWIVHKTGGNRPAWYLALLFAGLIVYESRLSLPLLNEQMSRATTCFFLGCIINELSSWQLFQKRLVKVALLVFIMLIYMIPKWCGDELYGGWEFIYTFFLFPALIVLFAKSGIIIRFSSNRVCRYIGDMSYAVYLLHYPMQFLLVILNTRFALPVDFTSISGLFIYIFTTLSVATLFHYLYEKPMNRYLRARLPNVLRR